MIAPDLNALYDHRDEPSVRGVFIRSVDGLIRRTARRWAPYRLEDAYQDGVAGALLALDRWDPSRASFNTYAWFFIRAAIMRRRAPVDEGAENVDGLDLAADSDLTPLALAMQRQLNDRFAAVLRDLKVDEMARVCVYKTVTEGRAAADVARELNCSHTTVTRAVSRFVCEARAKLEARCR